MLPAPELMDEGPSSPRTRPSRSSADLETDFGTAEVSEISSIEDPDVHGRGADAKRSRPTAIGAATSRSEGCALLPRPRADSPRQTACARRCLASGKPCKNTAREGQRLLRGPLAAGRLTLPPRESDSPAASRADADAPVGPRGGRVLRGRAGRDTPGSVVMVDFHRWPLLESELVASGSVGARDVVRSGSWSRTP